MSSQPNPAAPAPPVPPHGQSGTESSSTTVPAPPTPPAKGGYRLLKATSPYLLAHAQDPVEWYEWGSEAFHAAEEAGKPIMLSIGYHTCHWCHVMHRESFKNPVTASVLNENFINIKVDREQLPAVDSFYMAFLQASTGGGGWPMTVFCTPDRKPFLAGTYYPPEDSFGRPSFVTLLNRVNRKWRTETASIIESAESVMKGLDAHSGPGSIPSSDEMTSLQESLLAPGAKERGGDLAVPESALDNAVKSLASRYDSVNGGFGRAPKFPRPSELAPLLRFHLVAPATGFAKKGSEERAPTAIEMMGVSLEAMSTRGMWDHIDGGFHRYTVDGEFAVPHFEKMLYDQAQLVQSLLDLSLATGLGWPKTVVHETLRYVSNALTDSKHGYFYSAEDADSEDPAQDDASIEGAFYVWEAGELRDVLTSKHGKENVELFFSAFAVGEKGNCPPGTDPHGELTNKNQLRKVVSDADLSKSSGKSVEAVRETLQDMKITLEAVRSKRPRPNLDDKAVTAWNGIMIGAFARAGSVLEEPKYIEAAAKAARAVKSILWDSDSKRLSRSARDGVPHAGVNGVAEDYAFLISGLLDLASASGDLSWIDWAVELQGVLDTKFYDSQGGGYWNHDGSDRTLLLRLKEDYDGATPSENSVSVANLLRLAAWTGDGKKEYLKRAAATIRAATSLLRRGPMAVPGMVAALEWYRSTTLQVVIAGKGMDDPGTRALVRAASQVLAPNAVIMPVNVTDPSEKAQAAKLNPHLGEFTLVEGEATVYVCENFTCQMPVSTPEDVEVLLRDAAFRSAQRK